MQNFSKKVITSNRIYIFDVRTDAKGEKYITVTELPKGTGKRHCVFLYPENIGSFTEALDEAIGAVGGTDVTKS